MKPLFIEVTDINGNKRKINRMHIIELLVGGGKCFLRVEYLGLLEISESYKDMSTKLSE